MESSGIKQSNGNDKPRHPAESIPRLFWTLEETAARLGLSVRSFFVLREKHPLYVPDGSRTIIDDPKKDMPLWSDDLVRLIAFARSISSQGVRQLSDDEALRVRNGLGEARRREYLTFAE
jgi:hypothetical protein